MRPRFVLLYLLLLFLPVMGVSATRPAQNVPTVDFEEIDAFVRSEMERAGIPGLSLGIVQGDELIYMQGYGRADNTGRAVTPQTPFIIGSIGKTFTALAIRQLAAAGQVDLQAPVQRYLPDFTLADPRAAAQITIQHLLDHTSGIPQSAGEQAYQLDPQYTTAELVQKAADVTPNRPVGASYEYSNVNYLLLGLVIEAVSGSSYTDYVRENIWQPLDMAQSSFTEEAATGLAEGYRTWYGLRLPADIPFPAGMLPSGYGISTAEDLAHYLVAYLNDGQYENEAVLDADGFYDTYWNRLPGSAAGVETSQSGGTINYNADIHMLPGRGVGVAVLTNTRHLWDDLLPVVTAATIAQGVAYRAAGLPMLEPPAMSLWQSYLLLDLLAVAILAWAFFRLWRLIRIRRTAPDLNWRTIFPALVDVGLGLLILFGIPAVFNQRWDYILRTLPDLAGLVFIAGILLVFLGLVITLRFITWRNRAPVSIPVPTSP